jgi:Tfp pilus assembly protein PilF
MSTTTDRMTKLQHMLQKQPHDPFLLYALALEYKKIGQYHQALQYLGRVLQEDPGYCVAWLQSGQVHELAGNLEAARAAYRTGIEVATKKGDTHAADEMTEAIQALV